MEASSLAAEQRIVVESATRVDLRRFAWLLALLPFIGVALVRFTSGPGLEADDYAQYLLHARALAEGRAYADIGYIYSPYAHWIGPRAAPPGLPLLLTLVYSVVGPNMMVMKAIMLCFTITFIALAGAYFAKHHGWEFGLGVALLCGLSPEVVHGSVQLLTDLPFAAVLWAIIYLMDMPGALNSKRLAAVTILGAWLVLLRSAGLLMLPALLVFTVLRYRVHHLRPLIPVAVWATGLLLMTAILNIRDTSVVRLNPARVIVWLQNFSFLNLTGYFEGIFEGQLYPFAHDRLNDYFHVIASGLMLLGLITWLPQSYRRFGTIFAVIYSVLMLLVPAQQNRYLWPLYPFLVFGTLNGIRHIAAVIGKQPRYGSAAALLFAFLIVPGSVAAVMRQPTRLDLRNVPEVQDVYAYLERIRERRPVRVSFPKPRSLTWATRIPAMGPPYGPVPCLIAEFHRRHITHVVVGNVVPGERGVRALARIAREHPLYFTPVHRNRKFIVYRFTDPSLADIAQANWVCDIIEKE